MTEQLAHDAHQARLLQRREFGKEMSFLSALGKLGVVERIDLGASKTLLASMPICSQTVAATRSLSPVKTLTATPWPRGWRRRGGTCLGRIEEGQKAHQHHVALVGDAKLTHAARIGLLRHGDHAQALGIEFGDLLANLDELIFAERLGGAIDLDKGANLEHFLGSSLGNHLGFALASATTTLRRRREKSKGTSSTLV